MTKKLTDAEKERRRRERAKQREITPCRTKVTKADIAKVQRWASESASKGAIARRLGMDHKTFRVLMEQNPELRAAYDEGVEAEHQMLVSALKRQLDKSPSRQSSCSRPGTATAKAIRASKATASQ